jgi:threonine synthase
MKARLADFEGGYATEAQTAEVIKALYEKTGYVMDTHTAVAAHVYNEYKKATGDDKVTVIASTASPYKFTRSVMGAIDAKYEDWSDFDLVDELSRIAKVKVPNAIEEIRTAPVLHDTVCETEKMQAEVEKFLGL